MRTKFRKFERDRNVAEKFQILNNESEKLRNSTKMGKITFKHHLLSLKFH
jgi:hypothetical protein